MKIFHDNITELTNDNNYYRRVLATTPNMQLVVMSLKPLEKIDKEIHPYVTQFIRIEKGKGLAIVDGKQYELFDDVAIVIPLNTYHEIINTSSTEDLKLYTVYSPPNHPFDTVDICKPLND